MTVKLYKQNLHGNRHTWLLLKFRFRKACFMFSVCVENPGGLTNLYIQWEVETVKDFIYKRIDSVFTYRVHKRSIRNQREWDCMLLYTEFLKFLIEFIRHCKTWKFDWELFSSVFHKASKRDRTERSSKGTSILSLQFNFHISCWC